MAYDEIAPLLVSEKTAAKLIGLSNSTLIAARFRKQPFLPFVRVGKRAIRYRLTDIHDFVDRNFECLSADIAKQGDYLPRTAPRENSMARSTLERTRTCDQGDEATCRQPKTGRHTTRQSGGGGERA